MSSRLDRLVDQRFSRSLSEAERRDLEGHLASSPVATERYRRLHLMERVAALGPERALEEPSPLEIRRIANDLGLLEPEPVTVPFWAWITSIRTVGFSLFAAAAFAAALLLMPRGEVVTERGGTTWSASAYAVSSSGVERLGATVSTSQHLKFRVTREGTTAIEALSVVVRDALGATRVIAMEAPTFATDTVSVPGAVALDGFPVGPTTVWLVRDAAEDAAELDPTKVLGRFEVRLTGGPPK